VERESHNRRKNTLSGIGLFIFLSLVFHNYFTPNLARIHPFDGAMYVDAARGLTFGKLPIFSLNPGYAFFFSWFYRLAQLVWPENWMPFMVGSGQLTILAALIVAVWRLSKEIAEVRFTDLCLMHLVWPVYLDLFCGTADSLFAVSFILILVFFIRWWRTERRIWLVVLSVLLAVSAFFRSDGIPLTCIVGGVVGIRTFRAAEGRKLIRAVRSAGIVLLPGVLVLCPNNNMTYCFSLL